MGKNGKHSRPGNRRSLNSASKSTNFDICVDYLQTARDCIHEIRGATGVVYDEKMAEHKCMWDANYPECPERFTRVLERCKEYGLIDRCIRINPREATSDEILQLHTPDRIELLQGTDNSPDAEALEALSSGYDAIYIHPSTYKLALLAAGATIELVDSIISGTVQNGMAIIRPPGHHAMKSEYCGYCFYNNVALAAQHALEKGVSKILIVDWDVHHGQATQQMFYNDPRVLYFSIHRYENGEFWPNLRESDYHYIGDGPGYGYNVNIPLNQTKMGNADYLAIFHQVLLPMAYEYQPELIIVSAGYDAALGCLEGEMEVTPACYAHLTSLLMGLAHGKVAAVLEGGYCLKSLAEGAALTLRALLNDPCPSIGCVKAPSKSIQESILSILYVLRPLWKCFQFQGQFSIDSMVNQREIEGKGFWPTIIFRGTDIKPTKFATRNCYPVQSPELIRDLDEQLNQLIKSTNLKVPPHQVCLIYDERMGRHRNVTEPNHPERPERISAIYQLLEDYGLVSRCHQLPAREATKEELLMLHDERYLNHLSTIPQSKQSNLNEMQRKYGSIFLCPDSYEAALLSAGSAIQIVESILSGESRSGIGVIRPPGHHAEHDEAYGFCLLNNTALAAKYAIETHNLERILIVDWDVHHGNGIQRMFEEDPRVLYISLHRLDIFPLNVHESNCNFIGTGKGSGYTINIAWPKRGMGDAEYLAAFQQVILPIAYQYNPQLVLVAAGFDAARGDPLGGCKISPEGYGQMTHMLTSLANGRVAILLEGGYNLNSISYSMTMCCKALLGDPLPSPRLEPLIPAAVSTIKNVITVLRPYWSALQFLVDLPSENVLRPRWIKDSKIFLYNKRLCTIEDQLSELALEEPSQPVAPIEKQGVKNEEGAVGWNESSTEPKTLEEFLSLPDNVEAMAEGTLHPVIPLAWCPHLEEVKPGNDVQWGLESSCSKCQNVGENWVCLTCYEVNCSRFVEGHMVNHNEQCGHPLVLSFADLSVWCYACDSYIDNEKFYEAKNKIHLQKFGQPMDKFQQKEA